MPWNALITWEEDRNPSGPLPLQISVPVFIFSGGYQGSWTSLVCHPLVFPTSLVCVTLLCSPPLSSMLGLVRKTQIAS